MPQLEKATNCFVPKNVLILTKRTNFKEEDFQLAQGQQPLKPKEDIIRYVITVIGNFGQVLVIPDFVRKTVDQIGIEKMI